MNNKNYTITFGKAEELNENNYKEFAHRTMHYGDSFFFKDSEIEIWGCVTLDNQVVYYVDGVQHRVDLTSKRVSAKMGKEIESIILKAVAEHKEDKEIMDTKKIAKAMAKCFCSKETTEVGDYKFVFAWESGSLRKIIVYKKNDTIEGIETIGGTMEVVVANTILHREKLERYCEEKFGWMVLKNWARQSEYEGTDLYDYLSNKCAEEGISLDVLDKHSEDILSK